MISLKFSVKGDVELSNMLKELGVKIGDMREPLTMASEAYLTRVNENFKTSGRTFGEPWKPLSPSTIKIKRGLYAKGRSRAIDRPLVRTGALRDSFDYTFVSKTKVEFFSGVDYADVHQNGGKTRFRGKYVTIPRRVLMKIDDRSQDLIVDSISNWLDIILR